MFQASKATLVAILDCFAVSLQMFIRVEKSERFAPPTAPLLSVLIKKETEYVLFLRTRRGGGCPTPHDITHNSCQLLNLIKMVIVSYWLWLYMIKQFDLSKGFFWRPGNYIVIAGTNRDSTKSCTLIKVA